MESSLDLAWREMLQKPRQVKRRSDGAAREDGSLATRAYEQIREQILQGGLAMGDILSRRRLAQKLNMSFLPITEALQRLEAEGLVESQPRIGTRVRIPTEQDVVDSYVIREALETQSARLCCERMVASDKSRLKRDARGLDRLFRTGARGRGDSVLSLSVHTDHMRFHTGIAELAQSPGLLKAIEKEQVLIFNWLFDTASQRTSLPDHFHYDLAVALCSGDVLKADQAMRQHIRYGLNDVLEALGRMELSRRWRLKRGS